MSELTQEALDEIRTFAERFLDADHRIDMMDAKHELVARLLYWLTPLLSAAQRGIECDERASHPMWVMSDAADLPLPCYKSFDASIYTDVSAAADGTADGEDEYAD